MLLGLLVYLAVHLKILSFPFLTLAESFWYPPHILKDCCFWDSSAECAFFPPFLDTR